MPRSRASSTRLASDQPPKLDAVVKTSPRERGQRARLVPRAFFLDRDGVLNRRAPAGDYVKSAAEFAWLDGAREGVRRLNGEGYLVLVVTNQRGIARGVMTADDVEAIHARAQRELNDAGARVDAFYVCPHSDEDRCLCRKPEPGLILRAAREWNVDLADSFLVGDDDRDLEAARRAGVRARKMPSDGNLTETLADLLDPRASV
jgi:D-glycero-D-manno-heptose 1,7-bisphosphate phosphatase